MTRTRAPRSVLLTAVLAALVTAGALSTVAVLRPSPDELSAAASGDPSAASAAPDSGCGQSDCQVLARLKANGQPVELLAGNEGRSGRVRIGGAANPSAVIETAITAMDVRLNRDSLSCVEGPASACLVRGPYDRGMVGEVLVARGERWKPAEKPYFSDAGSIVLDDVTGDASPEIVVVGHDCAGTANATTCQASAVRAEVYDLGGNQVGCTRKYSSPGQLRGWPDVRLTASDLRACP